MAFRTYKWVVWYCSTWVVVRWDGLMLHFHTLYNRQQVPLRGKLSTAQYSTVQYSTPQRTTGRGFVSHASMTRIQIVDSLVSKSTISSRRSRLRPYEDALELFWLKGMTSALLIWRDTYNYRSCALYVIQWPGMRVLVIYLKTIHIRGKVWWRGTERGRARPYQVRVKAIECDQLIVGP